MKFVEQSMELSGNACLGITDATLKGQRQKDQTGIYQGDEKTNLPSLRGLTAQI